MVFVGCTANESQLDLVMDESQDSVMDKSSAIDTMLTASIEAVEPGELQRSATLLAFLVTNTTTKDQTFLTWNTPFENPLSADIFSVQLGSNALDYQGRLVKRGSPLPEHYQTIKAGESLNAIIDIANYYNMSAPGTYTVELDSSIIDGSRHLNHQAAMMFLPNTLVLNVP